MPQNYIFIDPDAIAELVMHLHAFPEETLRFLESKNQLLELIKYVIKDDGIGIVANKIHQKIVERL